MDKNVSVPRSGTEPTCRCVLKLMSVCVCVCVCDCVCLCVCVSVCGFLRSTFPAFGLALGTRMFTHSHLIGCRKKKLKKLKTIFEYDFGSSVVRLRRSDSECVGSKLTEGQFSQKLNNFSEH